VGDEEEVTCFMYVEYAADCMHSIICIDCLLLPGRHSLRVHREFSYQFRSSTRTSL